MKKQLEATLLAGILAGVVQSAPRPNILFIVVDDLNTEVGFLGDPHAITPNMDRLAAQSTVFENAQCQAPICGPSRNSFLTGRYPHHTGLYALHPLFRDVPELADVTALPQHFRNNGYGSFCIGKIYHQKADPLSFDKNFGWFGAFGPFPEKPLNLDPAFPVHPYYDWGAFLEDPETADYKVAETTVRLIKESAATGKPFFIAAGFFRPHCPLYAPQRWFDLHPAAAIPVATDQSEDMKDIPPYASTLTGYQGQQNYNQWLLEEGRSAKFLQAYRACVSFTDSCLGMVLDALRTSGHEENTVIIFCGDQGIQNGRKNLWYKRTLWESTARVPLLIKTPDQKRELRVKAPVGLIDIYPTLCELAGLPEPGGLDGLSLAGLIRGVPGSENRPPALTSHGPGNFSLRNIRWRYIRYADGSEELYDHEADPEERKNLAPNPEYAPVIAGFSPFVPKESKPFAPGSKEMECPAFPGK
jgi:arylsulfatase A-like enzyme